MDANELYGILADFFKPEKCTDIFKIGLQYHNNDYIRKVYTSTFASRLSIEKVLDKKEKDIMIFSHHPVPQKLNENDSYPEIPTDLIERLKESKVSLFSYHIPLDGHNLYSPSYTLALALKLTPFDTFYYQNGVEMGQLCKGKYSDVNSLKSNLENLLGHLTSLHCYGGKKILNNQIAIMAGCAKNPDIYNELFEKGINTFITGVTNKEITWVPKIHEQAKANGVNLIGGTHYSTEKFALIYLVEYFENLGIPSEFIEEIPNMSDI